jgi:mRNA interferase RelE/StbE
MAYGIFLKRSAEKELGRLPKKVHDRIVSRLLDLYGDPRPVGARKLQGRDAYRIRVANYRVLYTIDDSARRIEVISIGHRREVYR